MELKHTPWKAGPHPWPEQIGCCPLVGRPWSVHGTNNHNVAAAVSEDIARLIAAAPELLAVAKALASWDHCWPGNVNLETIARDARAAIAKATPEDTQ